MNAALLIILGRLVLEFADDIREIGQGEELTPEQEAAIDARWDRARADWKAELKRQRDAARTE